MSVPAAMLAVCSTHAAAQHSDEDELALSYGDPPLVGIATGSAQAIARNGHRHGDHGVAGRIHQGETHA